jgi:hypothetical protein
MGPLAKKPRGVALSKRRKIAMRFFSLIGFQHVILFFFPTLILVILLYFGFARLHFQGKDSEQRKKTIIHTYPDGIEARNAPFPLILILTIVGFLLWAVFYILGIGLTGVNI